MKPYDISTSYPPNQVVLNQHQPVGTEIADKFFDAVVCLEASLILMGMHLP